VDWLPGYPKNPWFQSCDQKNELQNVADTSDTLTMQSYAAIILRHSPTRATQDARAGCGKAGAAKSSLGTADSRH